MIRQFYFESYGETFAYLTNEDGTYVNDTRTPKVLSSLTIDMFDPDASGVAISSVEGLGPVDATIHTSEASSTDGGFYNGSKKTIRNINLDLIYHETETESIEQIRHKLYTVFRVKSRIKIKITTDTRILFTYGYVEKHEPNIFSQQSGCTISIVCPDCYFYGDEEYIQLLTNVESLFEFPFSTEVIADHAKRGIWDENIDDVMETQIIFGEITDDNTTIVNNVGDCDVGITIQILYTGSLDHFTFYNASTNEKFVINSQLYSGGYQREVLINTRQGEKSLIINGENNLSYIKPGNNWIHVQYGQNILTYTLEWENENVDVFVIYRNKYDGI